MPILEWLNKKQAIIAAKRCEYRLLEELPTLSYGDTPNENLLIQGDNLEALKALIPFYAGQIACVYIDPPFNTEQAFEHYDDNLEHSTWLSLLYPRLELLHDLLAEDALFWIHLDDSEVHYAKVALDEVFGRNHFVSHIAYERSSAAGIGQGGFLVDTTEHILCYRKNKTLNHNVKNSGQLDLKTLKRYNKYLSKIGPKRIVRQFNAKSNGMPVTVYEYDYYETKTVSLRKFNEREQEIKSELISNFDYLFRTNQIQKENEFQRDLVSNMDKSKLYSVEYTPSRGKHEGQTIENYYLNAELFSWLKDTAFIQDGEIVKEFNLTNFWRHEDIPKADIANEGDVKFSRGKKPEQLLRRVLEISTEPGDLVLDSFAGSGTTASVAHKMGRRYIAVEIGEHAQTLCQPRLQKVVDGEQSGISKAVDWQGDGGFRFCKLGETVFNEYGCLNTDIKFPTLAAHIWYRETRTPIGKKKHSPLLGIHKDTAYYLLYNGILGDKRVNGGNVLTGKLLANLPCINEQLNDESRHIVIYGESSRLGESRLKQANITFKQIPYDVGAL